MRETLSLRQLAVSALALTGIWNSLGRDMILAKVGDWMWEHLPEWAHKPLGTCPPCSASVWGIIVLILSRRAPTVVYVLALSGLMKLLAILVLDKEVVTDRDSGGTSPETV